MTTTLELWGHLKSLGKAEFTSALLDGAGIPSGLLPSLPRMPSESIQLATTGKFGTANLIEAVDFCDAVAAQYARHVDSETPPKVLDFGCGWGRIARALMRISPPDSIAGVDVRPEIIECARGLAPSMSFATISPRPPMSSIEVGSLDLLVAYSVFSHLSEDTAKSWIDEFGRIIRPGGLVCITTRARAHLVNSKKNSESTINLAGHAKVYATMLKDFDIALEKYDSGDFVYIPTGGGGVLTPDFYGEAIVPRSYVEKHWTDKFELVDWVDRFSSVAAQPIIVLKRTAQ